MKTRAKRKRKEDVISIDSGDDDEPELIISETIVISSDDEAIVHTKRPRKKTRSLPNDIINIIEENKIDLAPKELVQTNKSTDEEMEMCRFCKCEIKNSKKRSKGKLPLNLCNKDECWQKYRRFCSATLKCGHSCIGIKDELSCMECIHPKCAVNQPQTSEDPCNICFETLDSEPCIKLRSCGHIFHYTCIDQWVQQGYEEVKINFNNLNCPLCHKQMQHDELTESMWIGLKMKRDIEQLCKIGYDWIDQEPEVKDSGGKFYKNKLGYALHHISFYRCYDCDKPYNGGARQCEAGDQPIQFNKKELICGACANKRLQLKNGVCEKHGSEYIVFKCRFCCSLAVWFCGGSVHFCEKCHSGRGYHINNLQKCEGKGVCPLGGNHPPNGQEYALGCGLCHSYINHL